MIKWTTIPEEAELESKIARRAVTMARQLKTEYKLMDCIMDLDACHNNGCPLKLQELLNAEDVNIAHDVGGIHNNLNRKTGQLENCFLPRYSK
jgi:hypothetical protein